MKDGAPQRKREGVLKRPHLAERLYTAKRKSEDPESSLKKKD